MNTCEDALLGNLPSMFGNSKQKLAVNEIYVLASLYKRERFGILFEELKPRSDRPIDV